MSVFPLFPTGVTLKTVAMLSDREDSSGPFKTSREYLTLFLLRLEAFIRCFFDREQIEFLIVYLLKFLMFVKRYRNDGDGDDTLETEFKEFQAEIRTLVDQNPDMGWREYLNNFTRVDLFYSGEGIPSAPFDATISDQNILPLLNVVSSTFKIIDANTADKDQLSFMDCTRLFKALWLIDQHFMSEQLIWKTPKSFISREKQIMLEEESEAILCDFLDLFPLYEETDSSSCREKFDRIFAFADRRRNAIETGQSIDFSSDKDRDNVERMLVTFSKNVLNRVAWWRVRD